MAVDQRPGALYWVDHYVVPTTDLDRWLEWNASVLGATESWGEAPTAPGGPRRGEFRWLAASHVAGFIQDQPIPPAKALGASYPRYGFYIRQADIDEHLRRLDRLAVPHTDAIRTSAEGEPGLAIYLQDPDENQFELWAPDRLPDGVMAGESPVKVGRISHAIFESRDLDRTAAFYGRYCGLDPMRSADVAKDTMVLPLAGGPRLIFKKVDTLGVRTGGSTRYQGVHTAFIVRDEEFIPAYQRIWNELDEWEYDRRAQGPLQIDPGSLPARTGMHGSDAGRKWKAMYGRGDQIYDPDTNSFHFVGGTSSASPTLVDYEPRYMEEYVSAFMEAKARGEAR
jgi:catechol 2,3-dioxygenase-like lactoylglutathione lyase family enzyme